MLTAGIAMGGGGQGKSLLLPAVSGEGQGMFAEKFFAKSVDELMAVSVGTKTQLNAEQLLVGVEKKDASTGNDFSEAGTEGFGGVEISVSAGLSRVGATDVPAAFGGEGSEVPQTPSELDQSAKKTLVLSSTSGDIETAVVGKPPIAGSDELKRSVVAVAPQQSSLVLGGFSMRNGIAQVASNATFVSKEVINAEKIRTTAKHTVETKRETKKQGSELLAEDAKVGVPSVDSSVLPPSIGIATLSPATVLPVSVDVPVVATAETGVAPAKSFRVGSVGYKAGANAAAGIVANDGKGVERGKEMLAGVDTTSAAGIHSVVGHSSNAEAVSSKTEVSSAPGSGEVVVKSHGSGGIAATSAVPVVVVDGSGVQGVVQKHSSVLGNEVGLRADTVDGVTAQSQVSSGDAASVYDGHRMLAATPTSLEVGVANGSHGWLKIRAELTDGGGVNASVSAASPEGQEMLHRELPSLTAYLQAERLGVNTVVVHTSAATTEALDSSGVMSNGDQRGQTPQGSSSQSGDTRQGLVTDEPVSFMRLEGADADALSSTMYEEGGLGGGGWLSVRA